MKHNVLPLDQLQSWGIFNNVEFKGVKISPNIVSEDGTSKGGGIISTAKHAPGEALLVIPSDLILCKEQILQATKSDKHFRQLIEAVDDFIEVGSFEVSFEMYTEILLRHRGN